MGGMRPTVMHIEIARPPAELYPWLVEPERLRRWVGGLAEVRGTGAQRHERIQMGGRTYTQVTETLRTDPPLRLETESRSESMRQRVQWALEPTGAGTRLTVTVQVRMVSLWGRLLGRLVAGGLRHKLRGDLARLKAFAERDA